MDVDLVGHLTDIGRSAGLDAVAVTDASPLLDARDRIEDRKARGLHGGMWFTYGRPERSTDPSRVLPTARSIVVGAMRYHRSGSEDDPSSADGPEARVARYVWEPTYDRLGTALGAVADELRSLGHEAVVVYDDNRLVDRAAAYRAGIGWIGKNTNLLSDELGSWFVLGSVVTDCDLPGATDVMADGCGTCVRCQTACPTGALDAAGELDARRCLAWLVQADGVFPVEHRVALGDRIYGCDDCQEVCPPNTRLLRISPSPTADSDAMITVDVLDMLTSSDTELMARHGDWYVPRRQPEYLRRNALVVLANVGAPTPQVRSVVEGMLASSSSIERAHAVWAAKRLGFDDLLENLDDDNADVAAELGRVVARREDLVR